MKTDTHLKALQEAVDALWPKRNLNIGAHAYRRMVEQAAQHQKMSAETKLITFEMLEHNLYYQIILILPHTHMVVPS